MSDIEFNKKVDKITNLLNRKIKSMTRKRANTLLNWLNVWVGKYLDWELNFKPEKLKFYKRGEVVFANFGFKVGHELGGLHFAIIVENDNGNSNGNVVVIPLRSLEEGQSEDDIDKKYEVFLGKGLFEEEIKVSEKIIESLNGKIESCTKEDEKFRMNQELEFQLEILDNLNKGSVAKLSQICSLSKIRIYLPRKKTDRFSTFKLDPAKMNEIDDKIKLLYIKKEKESVDKNVSIV